MVLIGTVWEVSSGLKASLGFWKRKVSHPAWFPVQLTSYFHFRSLGIVPIEQDFGWYRAQYLISLPWPHHAQSPRTVRQQCCLDRKLYNTINFCSPKLNRKGSGAQRTPELSQSAPSETGHFFLPKTSKSTLIKKIKSYISADTLSMLCIIRKSLERRIQWEHR